MRESSPLAKKKRKGDIKNILFIDLIENDKLLFVSASDTEVNS